MLVFLFRLVILFSIELVSLSITKFSPFIVRFFNLKFTHFHSLFSEGFSLRWHLLAAFVFAQLVAHISPLAGALMGSR
jgi:hypothetical protein